MTSVVTPTTIPGVTPAMTSGLPALPMAAIKPSFDAEIGFVNAGPVEDQRVGDQTIQRVLVADPSGLAHAFANDFAAAEFAFIAINGVILLHFEKERRVAQPDFVARWSGRTCRRNVRV